jgi:uncharacterized membrane protein YphA (DoxX/SURF4 family)
MAWKYSFWTAVFLVMLRLAIGWHFCYEGYHKVHSIWLGETTSNKPFTSAGYFREAHGPLGGVVQRVMGDADDRLLERLTLAPPPEQLVPKEEALRLQMPPALAREWEAYYARFLAQNALQGKELAFARTIFEGAEINFVTWLKSASTPVTKTYSSGTVEVNEPNAQRVEEYRRAVQDLRDTYAKELPAFGKDVEKTRLLKTKADVARLRQSLQTDLDEQTSRMKKGLVDALLTRDVKTAVLPEVETENLLSSLDVGTAWFLFIVGATLLFGLLTRTSCLLAAGFLLMTYLSTPAFPWLPVPPNQEGSYFFVSKNVIEMLALLTLATTPSGRWFGVDAVLHQMGRLVFGRRRPVREPELIEA